jgi:hypothetical protein
VWRMIGCGMESFDSEDGPGANSYGRAKFMNFEFYKFKEFIE